MKKNISLTKSLFSYQKRCLHGAEIRKSIEITTKLKYNPVTQEKEYEKEFLSTHKYGKYHTWLIRWYQEGFKMGWFNHNRDTEQGNARVNCGGAYPNKLASLFYRSKKLQSPFFMKMAMRFLDKRAFVEGQIAEPQPNITTNSVFIYKDNSNYFINRRGLERLFLTFIAAQGLNFTGILMYTYIGFYFLFFVRLFLSSSAKNVLHHKSDGIQNGHSSRN